MINTPKQKTQECFNLWIYYKNNGYINKDEVVNEGRKGMDGKRNYLRCNNISGNGTFCDNLFNSSVKFKVINLSGSGVLIKTKRKFDVSDVVEMKIEFGGYINEKRIVLKGKVMRQEVDGEEFRYGMEFVDISHEKKVEIDEIMNLSCSREHDKSLKNCDYGECTFLK